jgi:hypothetical protein
MEDDLQRARKQAAAASAAAKNSKGKGFRKAAADESATLRVALTQAQVCVGEGGRRSGSAVWYGISIFALPGFQQG